MATPPSLTPLTLHPLLRRPPPPRPHPLPATHTPMPATLRLDPGGTQCGSCYFYPLHQPQIQRISQWAVMQSNHRKCLTATSQRSHSSDLSQCAIALRLHGLSCSYLAGTRILPSILAYCSLGSHSSPVWRYYCFIDVLKVINLYIALDMASAGGNGSRQVRKTLKHSTAAA